MRKDAVYARQSLEKEDSYSIEKQIEDCKRRIGTDTPFEIFIDKGYSGKNTERPEFQRMMQEVSEGKIQTIYCYKLDRISRNLLDFNLMWQELQANDCNFVSCTESMLDTTTPAGQAQVQMIMLFAQFERQTIALRVKDNYYFRITQDGRWASGPAPYGFKNARTPDNKPTLSIIDNEMEAVKYCFNRYASSPNVSLNRICRELKEKGYRSSRANGAWDSTTVARILQSTVYVVADIRLQKYLDMRKINFLNEGEWTGETSCHIVAKNKGNTNIRKCPTLEKQYVYLTNFEGVIDSKTYIMVQERLADNEQFKRSNGGSKLKELAGLLKCKECGYAVKAYSQYTKTGHVSLGCHGRSVLKVCDTSFKNVEFEEVREKVGQEVQKRLDNVAMEILEDLAGTKRKDNEISALNVKIENLLELVELGGASAKKAYARIEKLEEEIKQIQLDDFMDTKATERLRISDSLPLKYIRMSEDEKKSICQQMIEKILLSDNGDIEIIWKM